MHAVFTFQSSVAKYNQAKYRSVQHFFPMYTKIRQLYITNFKTCTKKIKEKKDSNGQKEHH